MLVDPRPYTYEYRKPRFSNPTFQSRNLYGSLYHNNAAQTNDYFAPSPSLRYQSSERLPKFNRSQALQRAEANVLELNNNKMSSEHNQSKVALRTEDPERNHQSFKLPSIRKNQDLSRLQSDLRPTVHTQSNNNLPIQKRQGFERFRVYEGQQNHFNIINYYPKQETSYRLRNFPKLTLEDKLFESGNYHKLD